MKYWFDKFRDEEDAAVTVDWVVLTAAIVGLGIGVITIVTGGAIDQTNGIEANLAARSVGVPGG